MPFDQIIPRPFTPSAIRTYAPAVSGVYGISNERKWIYIGATPNIQSALLAHLADSSTSLMKSEPSGFVFEVCDEAGRLRRQDRLVFEYEPTVNRHSSRRTGDGSIEQ